jgi:hypothetical protein
VTSCPSAANAAPSVLPTLPDPKIPTFMASLLPDSDSHRASENLLDGTPPSVDSGILIPCRGLGLELRERRSQGLAPKSYEYISEFFDENGRLLALGYEKRGARSRDSLYAWMGAVVPYDAFRMKTHILYSKARPGDR